MYDEFLVTELLHLRHFYIEPPPDTGGDTECRHRVITEE